MKVAIIFAFSVQKGWKGKFEKDFASAKSNKNVFNQFIFCTNQRASPTDRDKIKGEKAKEGVTVDFYDRDRIQIISPLDLVGLFALIKDEDISQVAVSCYHYTIAIIV
jgi:hypothetical protein